MKHLTTLLSILSVACAANSTVWDYAPPFAGDQIQPYPSLTDADGHNITVENLRGTHLYGWKGCSGERSKLIQQAYDDFYKLSNQLEVYNNIDWNSQAATDFWGPASGTHQIPDDTRKEIAQIFKAAQQVYSYPWTWQPPWLSWRQLWIEVRCSDGKKGKGAPDPLDTCGDAEPDPGQCPNGQAPVGGGKATLQAFSDPKPDDSRYSRITFCTDFFKLQELSVVTENNNKLAAAQKKNLALWDNQARCMFHEITHLDYFMNAGPADDKKALSPFVSDLEVFYTDGGKDDWFEAYGPFNARILRNWVEPDPAYSAYYTQRNADNYAWFAMANYVQKQINQYPSVPSPGRRRPKKTPRDSQTHDEPALAATGLDTDLISNDDGDNPDNGNIPGCGDKIGPDVAADVESASISSQYSPTSTPTPTPSPTSDKEPSCLPSSGAGLRQSAAQSDIDSFCGSLKMFGGCPVEDGSSVVITNLAAACGSDTPTIQNFYYDTGDTMYLNVTLVQGSSFRIDPDQCKTALYTVLNGCAPFVASSDGSLLKYGGSIKVAESDAAANFQIFRQPAQAIS